jgi:hypothetical protein
VISILLYYVIATILFCLVCYIIYMVNKKGTYQLLTPEGEILKRCRTMFMARLNKDEQSQILERDDLIIKKVKKNGREKA